MILSTLKEYLQIRGIAGRENAPGEVIAEKLRPHCDSVQIDPMGNVLALKRGTSGSGRILFTAHMDEVGFFVTHIGDDGLIRVAYLGAVVPAAAAYAKVIFENGTVGVLTPTHEDGPFLQEDVVIDIGAKDRRSAERRIKIGDFATFTPDLTHLVGNRYLGYPLDDRLGCAVLTELAFLPERPVADVWFAFTVQQQLGNRGAQTATFTVKPDLALSLDLIPSDDAVGGKGSGAKLGGGAVLVHKSGNFISDRTWTNRLLQLAEEGKIPHQDAILAKTTTDAASIQSIGAGAASVLLGIPARNLRTGAEMIDMADVKSTLVLAKTVLTQPI